MPIVRNQIEGRWFEGYTSALNGISLTQLNCIWLAFAMGTWGAAFAANRGAGRILRAMLSTDGEKAMPFGGGEPPN
jgi:hypothetical protein